MEVAFLDKQRTVKVGGGLNRTIRYDIQKFNVDSKAEYSALSSTRSQKIIVPQPPSMSARTPHRPNISRERPETVEGHLFALGRR